MEDYNKIIESLQIRFIKARNINIMQPITIENNYEVENYLLLVKNGAIKFGKEKEEATKNQMIFVPLIRGKQLSISYGSGIPTILSKDDFISHKEQFLKPSYNMNSFNYENYSYVAFETKAFDSVNFFNSLDIPAFKIDDNEKTNPAN